MERDAWNGRAFRAAHVPVAVRQGSGSEQFLWRIERGGPVLLGYHVNSPLLLAQ